MALQHSIPIHLEAEDAFLFTLTARQCLILGCGIALGGPWIGQGLTLVALVWSTLVGCAILGVACAVALVHLARRGLDTWGIIWLLYALQPRRFLWSYARYTRERADQRTVERSDYEEEEDNRW